MIGWRSQPREGIAFASALAVLAAVLVLPAPAGAQGWPEVFDPTVVLTLHLEMANGDWSTVQGDASNTIQVPAQFWAEGEAPIPVTVRRKSSTPLGGGGFSKVGLSIDFNAVVIGQEWRDLKKLNLETGDGSNVLYEGFAWQLVDLASGTLGFGYRPSLASWVRLFINGTDTGVYINVEKIDKRFFENRGIFVDGQTWLYEDEDVGPSITLHEGGPQNSPTYETLCYAPFAEAPSCPAPADIASHAAQHVEMRGLLTEMAVDTFNLNNDALYTKEKNFYFADFTTGRKRMYFPWDLDATRAPGDPTSSIYGDRFLSDFADLLLVPELRSQFEEIVGDLICGPWSSASVIARLDAIEPAVAPIVDADPNAGSSTGFDALRSWITARVAHVAGELPNFQGCPTVQLQLNEVMASNAAFLEDPVEPGEFPDWFEIYNPAAAPVEVGGIYVSDDLLNPTKYQIPAGVTIPALGHLLMYADDDGTQGPDHTNFKLSAAGGVLALHDRDGLTQLDAVTLGPARVDVAYGRFPDGNGPWAMLSQPTPGLANALPNPPPTLTDVGHEPAVPGPSDGVLVRAAAGDESAVAAVTLFYDAGTGAIPLAMRDDGTSGDGAAGDGVFAASIPPLPIDTIVDYWITATDDLGASTTSPAPGPAAPIVYVVSYTPPPLVINEFVASSDVGSGLEDPDEIGAYEDWLELYNAGSQPIVLDGMYLTDNLNVPTRFALPPGLVVPAGGHLHLWADFEPLQGPTHLGFQLAAIGEEIGLFDTDARGNVAIDVITFGPQQTNVSEGRCPDGFSPPLPASQTGVLAFPTPGASNLTALGCPDGGTIRFSGIATGGVVIVQIAGVVITVTVAPGEGAEEIAIALAAAINADTTLAARGIRASSLGVEVALDGAMQAFEVVDETLTAAVDTPSGVLPPTQVPMLPPAAFGVLILGLAVLGGRVLHARSRA